jgi:hypothetical protein
MVQGLLAEAGCCVVGKQQANVTPFVFRGELLTHVRLQSSGRPRRCSGTRAALSTGPLSPPPKPLGGNSSLVPIIDKIAACVEANDSVQRFETVAGRAAMIGFAVAVAAELVLPRGGLFGGFDGALFSSYSTVALLAVCASSIVATVTKQHIGGQVKEAVFTSLTAVSRSKSSLSLLDVDSAVDAVFSSVFSREMLSAMTDEHEWI